MTNLEERLLAEQFITSLEDNNYYHVEKAYSDYNNHVINKTSLGIPYDVKQNILVNRLWEEYKKEKSIIRND